MRSLAEALKAHPDNLGRALQLAGWHLLRDARFALETRHIPGALSFAAQNCVTHKTPADARVLVEAALAGGNPAAAASIAEFVANTRLEDKALARRLAALGFGAR